MLQTLFSISAVQAIDDNYIVRLCPKLDSIIYKAHFPGAPITPGACLVMAVGELIEYVSGRKVLLKNLKNVKFLSMVVPDVDSEILFDIHVDWLTGKTRVEVVSSGIIRAKMSMTYAEV
ncbi:MAG: hypothetical protein KBT04_07565 [Bacteroidales bacterium]|nr:hypothetical protein [Candidatus Colimorpha onthohippi]